MLKSNLSYSLNKTVKVLVCKIKIFGFIILTILATIHIELTYFNLVTALINHRALFLRLFEYLSCDEVKNLRAFFGSMLLIYFITSLGENIFTNLNETIATLARNIEHYW